MPYVMEVSRVDAILANVDVEAENALVAALLVPVMVSTAPRRYFPELNYRPNPTVF